MIALADGLGSAFLADTGAEVAVKAAAGSENAIEDSAEMTRIMVCSARDALEMEASIRGAEPSDLACTLIVAVAVGNRLRVSHIGDGAVVAETEKGIVLASPPGESEYANEVEHLAGDSWEENLRTTEEISGVGAFAVFTDGCQRAALTRNGDVYTPHPAFFEPLFAWAHEAFDLVTHSDELRSVLTGAKLSEHSEDDKTLALAILGGDGSL